MVRKGVHFHETNRRSWNAVSPGWQSMVDRAGVWKRCHRKPSLVLNLVEMRLLGKLRGKRVCVLGSGDNKVVFALSGMGAKVTSVDISEVQLAIAGWRAEELGLDIRFVRSDVTHLPKSLPGQPFDLVYTGGHVAVWVANLRKYYSEAARVLRPGGRLIVSEYHPFRRLWWNDERNKRVMERSYFDRRPQHYDRSEEVEGARRGSYPSVEFMWTVGDMVNAMMDAPIALDHFTECGEEVEDWEPPVKGLPGLLILSGRKR